MLEFSYKGSGCLVGSLLYFILMLEFSYDLVSSLFYFALGARV